MSGATTPRSASAEASLNGGASDAMVIVNLFAIRGTDPKIVRKVSDPVGPLNNFHIREALRGCGKLVCAWGCGGHMKGDLCNRPAAVLEALVDLTRDAMPVECLGYSADGSPRHPLMLPYSTPLEPFHLWRKIA